MSIPNVVSKGAAFAPNFRFKKTALATLLTAAVCMLQTPVFAATLTYTMQTGDLTGFQTYDQNSNSPGKGDFNSGGTGLGFYAHDGGGGIVQSVGFETLNTSGNGSSGFTGRSLQVGDQFNITIQDNTAPYGFGGIFFNQGTSNGSASNYNTNNAVGVALLANGIWSYTTNGGSSWTSTSSTSPGTVSIQLNVTSANTFNLSIGGTLIASDVSMSSPGLIQSIAMINQNDKNNGGATDLIFSGASVTNSGTVSLGGLNNSGTIAGTINNGLASNSTSTVSVNSLNKIGSGTIAVSGNNGYTGPTLVSAGQLTVQNNNGVGTGGITVSAGAKLVEDSGVTFTNTVTLASATSQFNRNVANGGSYAGMSASSSFGNNTTFSLLGGTNGSGSAETLLTTLTNTPTHDTSFRASDVLSLSGNSGQKFVLQLSYNPADIQAGQTPYLGWYDTARGTYVNAVYGNSTPGSIDGTGELTGSWAANGSTLTLGAFGVDTSTDTVWAVVDHNSEFAVIPEPSTYAMIMSGFAIFVGFKRARRRAFPVA